MVDFKKDMSRGKANEDFIAQQDKLCIDALERAKVEEMFSWVELTDEQILLIQKICAQYTKFALELLETVPFSSNRDEALKVLVSSQHHALDAITELK